MRVFLVVIFLALNALAGEVLAGDSAVAPVAAVATPDTAQFAPSAPDSASSAPDTTAAPDSASSAPATTAASDSAATDTCKRYHKSIPLPRLSAYTGHGLLAGLAGGLYSPTEECDCLGVWQGQMEYFYKDWISAGFDVRFFGGDLDADMSVVYQRYRLNTRFHFPHVEWDWYVGPVFGFESTNLESIREEWHNRESEWWIPGANQDKEPVIEDCEKMFSLDGFSIGVDIGAGVSVFDIFGITGSLLYEYNFGGAQLLTISPGIAYNMQELWPWAKKSLSAMWISIETGFQRFFNRSVDSWALSFYLGGVIGF